MKTVPFTALGALLVFAGACASAPSEPAQPRAKETKQDKKEAGAAAAIPGIDEATLQRMTELATPGPEHEWLAKQAGEWDVAFKVRMMPGAPWVETKGTTEAKTMLGGRYLIEHSKFEMMGMPMEGVNIFGFDKMTGEYTSMWADSMSTWWISTRGKKDASGAIDLRGTMTDVAGTRPFRMVMKPQADGSTQADMYDTIEGQGEVLTMQITSKRKH
jgi:hypothetical protein